MSLIDDALFQMENNQWFSALDLKFDFWQIQISPNDIKQIIIITKSSLYD
jgi:hypothetical protein